MILQDVNTKMSDFLLTQEETEKSLQKYLPKVIKGIKEAGKSIMLNAEKW